MKYSTIVCALITALMLAVGVSAQVSSQRLTFSEAIDPATGDDVFTIRYAGPYNPNLRLYEATVLGSVEGCFDNRVFSRPRGVDLTKTLWSWHAATGTYEIIWTVKRENRDTCKVLIGDSNGESEGRDFLVWQRNFGVTGFYESDAKADDSEARSGDGSVRSLSYSIAYGNGY